MIEDVRVRRRTIPRGIGTRSSRRLVSNDTFAPWNISGASTSNESASIYPYYYQPPGQFTFSPSKKQAIRGYFNAHPRKFITAACILAMMLVASAAIHASSTLQNTETAKKSTFVEPAPDNHDQTTGAQGSSSTSSSSTNSSNSSQFSPSGSPTNTSFSTNTDTGRPQPQNQPTPMKTVTTNLETQSSLSTVHVPLPPVVQQQVAQSTPTAIPSESIAASATVTLAPSNPENNTISEEPSTPASSESISSPSAKSSKPPQKNIVTGLLSGVLGLLF